MSKLNIERLKQQAKKLKKEQNISQSQALDEIAKENKYGNWKAVIHADQKQKITNIPTPPISINFASSDDIQLDNVDEELLQHERAEELDVNTRLFINENKKSLTKLGIEFSIFEPTATGLKKGILDATQPVRTHFQIEDFHNYEKQLCGQDSKVIKDAIFLESQNKKTTTISMYRPITKLGDPRMWFSKLPYFCKATNQIAIIIYKNTAYLLNLSEINIDSELSSEKSKIRDFLNEYLKESNDIAFELLSKLKALSHTLIKATHNGDTAIGMSIENALGIAANSSKLPDYKGIELKSGRNAKNRTTLFAQVANWSKSPYDSSTKILDKFGYLRDNDTKLYCTLSTIKPNSQGLQFIYNKKDDMLEEWYISTNKKELIACWDGITLRNRLYEKHAETFWIDAESQFIDGVEYFKLKKITHTKSPVLSQLMPLIESGVITMDHLIKRSYRTNRVSEKGPLFKMHKKYFEFIFPAPIIYQLD